jgi:hypothetical protein
MSNAITEAHRAVLQDRNTMTHLCTLTIREAISIKAQCPDTDEAQRIDLLLRKLAKGTIHGTYHAPEYDPYLLAAEIIAETIRACGALPGLPHGIELVIEEIEYYRRPACAVCGERDEPIDCTYRGESVCIVCCEELTAEDAEYGRDRYLRAYDGSGRL